jgi:hypothetical protein
LHIPFVLANIFYLDALNRICVEDLSYHVSALVAHEGGYLVIGIKNLFVQKVGIGVLKG